MWLILIFFLLRPSGISLIFQRKDRITWISSRPAMNISTLLRTLGPISSWPNSIYPHASSSCWSTASRIKAQRWLKSILKAVLYWLLIYSQKYCYSNCPQSLLHDSFLLAKQEPATEANFLPWLFAVLQTDFAIPIWKNDCLLVNIVKIRLRALFQK